MLQGLDVVQSVTLLSMQQFHGDPFEVCSGLFKVDKTGIRALGLGESRQAAMCHLLEHGYVVLDDFMDPGVTVQVAKLVQTSLADYPHFKDDGIIWTHPSPRNARGDLTTWLAEGKRPGLDEIFSKQILPAFRNFQDELGRVVAMRGGSEQQLAWYPGDGSGYKRHTDAMPDADGGSDQRKVTAILYCNQSWEPSHGGILKLWKHDRDGGGIFEVEPVAGRLLVFMSGCMLHEVAPSHKDRYAITNWFN